MIGHVGRFFAQKNHRFLLEIFAQIHKRNADAVLLLVGDGELRGEIEKQIRDSGLDECVILAGVQSDVNPYYHAMDVMLLPSLYEGKPFVIIEAQASGLPCVISDKVPSECILVKGLVTQVALTESAKIWADNICSCVDNPRFGYAQKIKDSGYDISQNTYWLQNFYLSKGKSFNE